MEIQKSFQCHACQSFLSHPIDTCPVCGDQFYWLVKPTREPTPLETKEFIDYMTRLVEGRASQEFLTHGGHLWLPHRFWDFNPSGETLESFPWIARLEHFQHDAEQQKIVDKEQTPWDTLPKMPVIKAEELAPKPHNRQVESQDFKAASRTDSRVSKSTQNQKPSREPAISKQLFAPLMILVFFILLSLSFLTLRYHKNHRVDPSPMNSEEIADEPSILP